MRTERCRCNARDTATLYNGRYIVNAEITIVTEREAMPTHSIANRKEDTRDRIIEAAGRGFRKHGYGGTGVDGLAREAGVTSGAFYGHFSSKAEAFKVAIVAGMQELLAGVSAFQVKHGPAWIPAFTEFYLGDKRRCDLGESCSLPSLSPEVARADNEVQIVYQRELIEISKAVQKGLPDGSNPSDAWVFLALLTGGQLLARAVADKALSDEIAKAVEQATIKLHQKL